MQCCFILYCIIVLAATKQLYEWFSPSVHPHYKFEIVNYPDLSGNIPHGAAYGVDTSQVIRYARVCNDADDFKERVKVLTNKLIIKGFTINHLKNTMKKCLGKHSWIAKKYKGLAMQNLY